MMIRRDVTINGHTAAPSGIGFLFAACGRCPLFRA